MKNKSLKSVIQTGIIVFFTVIILALSGILILINSYIRQANDEYSGGIALSASNIIAERIEKLDKTSKMCSENLYMQQYITESDEYQKKVAFSNVFSDIRKVIQYTNDNMYVMAWDNAQNRYDIINMLDDIDKQTVDTFYEENKAGELRNGLRLFVDRGSVIICKFKNINMYNLSGVGYSSIGVVGVAAKISLVELRDKLNLGQNVTIKLKNETLNEEYKLSAAAPPKKQQVVMQPIGDTQWSVICITQANRIPKTYLKIRNTMIGMILLCIAFFLTFSYAFHRLFTRPVDKIMNYLDGYVIGGKEQRLESIGVAEFDKLLIHINDMLLTIENDTRQIIKNQEELYEKESEINNVKLYMYQLQIQPHFLYNTLGCINGCAVENESEKILQITNSLADIFRYSMDEKTVVSLGDEIEYAQRYMNIQEIRFPELLKFRIDIDDELLAAQMPKIILQPIVENAFKHGILPIKKPGVIMLSGEKADDKLILKVNDTGKGMSPERLKEIRGVIENCKNESFSSGSIGISNVCKRIILGYGAEYGVEIDSEENAGTTVTITLPFVLGEDFN